MFESPYCNVAKVFLVQFIFEFDLKSSLFLFFVKLDNRLSWDNLVFKTVYRILNHTFDSLMNIIKGPFDWFTLIDQETVQSKKHAFWFFQLLLSYVWFWTNFINFLEFTAYNTADLISLFGTLPFLVFNKVKQSLDVHFKIVYKLIA